MTSSDQAKQQRPLTRPLLFRLSRLMTYLTCQVVPCGPSSKTIPFSNR